MNLDTRVFSMLSAIKRGILSIFDVFSTVDTVENTLSLTRDINRNWVVVRPRANPIDVVYPGGCVRLPGPRMAMLGNTGICAFSVARISRDRYHIDNRPTLVDMIRLVTGIPNPNAYLYGRESPNKFPAAFRRCDLDIGHASLDDIVKLVSASGVGSTVQITGRLNADRVSISNIAFTGRREWTICKLVARYAISKSRMSVGDKCRWFGQFGLGDGVAKDTGPTVKKIFTNLRIPKKIYKLDLFTSAGLKISIECNENGRRGYRMVEDRKVGTSNKFGCRFVRYDPYTREFYIEHLVREIN